jgi:hypothetical protein
LTLTTQDIRTKKNTQTDMLEDPNHCFEDQREQNECIQLYQDPEIPLCEDGTSVFVDQIPKDELFDSIEKLLTSCSKHKNEELKFVCQCGELICLRCAIEHQDHIKEEMEETTEDDRVNIEQLVMQNQRDVQLIEESLSEVIGTMERIEKSCFNECTKILNEAKLLKAQIDRKVKKLVNEIKEITNSKLKNLQEQKEKLNKMALGIKIGNMELIDHSQLVQMKKEINRKHKTEHTDSFELYLENNKLLTNIQEPSHEANSDMVSIEHCVVSNVQENVFINMETQFTIQLKTKDGQNLRCGVEPNVIITDTQKQLVRYKMKFNEKDGLFVVNYTPQNEGLHFYTTPQHRFRQHLLHNFIMPRGNRSGSRRHYSTTTASKTTTQTQSMHAPPPTRTPMAKPTSQPTTQQTASQTTRPTTQQSQPQAQPQMGAPNPGLGGGSFLANVASAATGAFIGSSLSRAIFGSGERSKEAEKNMGPCAQPFGGFMRCLEEHEKDIGSCQWAFDTFQQCNKNPQAFQSQQQ